MDDSVRILHVDNDAGFAARVATTLEEADERFEVVTESTPEDALDRLTGGPGIDAIDCIVSEYDLPEMDGIAFLEAINDHFPNAFVPFVLLTDAGSEAVAAEALNAGASSYVQKDGEANLAYLISRIREDIHVARAQEARSRFDTLVEALNDPVYVLDDQGRFVYVNDAFVALTGYDREEILGSDPSLIKREPDLSKGEDQLGEILSDDGPESITFELDVYPKDGEPIPCEDHMSVLPYEGEQFRGSLGVLRDISERKARQRALREAKEHYQLVVEQDLIGLYLARHGELLYHNAAFAEQLGYPAEASRLVDRPFRSLVAAEDRDRFVENLWNVEAGNVESIRQPYQVVTADGQFNEVEILAQAITLDGEPAVIGTLVDVDTDEEQYWDLRRERDRLDEFTSVVSHDLRNPLNVAQGNLEIAAETDDETTRSESIAAATDALARMAELLDDLLSLAQEGETVDSREPVSLRAVAEAAWDNVSAPEATLEVTASGMILADPTRLKGVFENLYQNAIDHVGPEVTITVDNLHDRDGFYVEDNGPGIPPEDRGSIFDRGYTTADDGTGYGLAIVEQIVTAHGWQIGLAEDTEGGARFEIWSEDQTMAAT